MGAPTGAGGRKAFEVLLNTPFHLSGESERSRVGQFDDCAAAVEACRKLVDRFLQARREGAATAEDLYVAWRDDGPEPWVEASGPGAEPCVFAADAFARRRCRELLPEEASAREAGDDDLGEPPAGAGRGSWQPPEAP